jgi:transcriptional regulator with XRE-family HTH domain
MSPKLIPPTPAVIKAGRLAAGLTQSEAAEFVHLTRLETWSEYERGVTAMDNARWELFLVKTGQSPYYRPARGVPVPKARKVQS